MRLARRATVRRGLAPPSAAVPVPLLAKAEVFETSNPDLLPSDRAVVRVPLVSLTRHEQGLEETLTLNCEAKDRNSGSIAMNHRS